jgi:hypothetical protein
MTDITPDRPRPLWTLEEAVALCRAIEAVAPAYGCHVALTGGVLYKDGPRKDLDLLFYRVRQVVLVDQEGLFVALSGLGVVVVRGRSWCFKAVHGGRTIDMFFPEEDTGNVGPSESELASMELAERRP